MTFVIDVFSRRVVGWKAAQSMSASLVVDALNMAPFQRPTEDTKLECRRQTAALLDG